MMMSMLRDHLHINGLKLLPGPSSHASTSPAVKQSKSGVGSHRYVKSIKDHVKGRLSLGAKILQAGGTEKVFKRIFSLKKDGEQLLKAFHCCLFTTAGPIQGVLFISSNTLAFCSDKSVVKVPSPTGELLRFQYKVVIPLSNIAKTTIMENVNKTSQKYLHVTTMDDFEFWFMGLINYKKMFYCLQGAVSRAQWI